MKNKFVIITTCYNVMPYLEMNIQMNKYQSYSDVLFVYVDDKSKDSSYNTLLEQTKDDDRFLVIQNPNNGSQAKAFMYAIEYLESTNLIQDEDIIVEVDGDSIKVDDSYVWELDSVNVEPYTDDSNKNRYVAKVRLSSIEENYLNQPLISQLLPSRYFYLLQQHCLINHRHPTVVNL